MKPGWKTSEFWLTVVIAGLGFFMASGLVADGSTPIRIAGMAMATLKTAAYSLSRGMAKQVTPPATQVAQGDVVNVAAPTVQP